jgi:hypothetical protein
MKAEPFCRPAHRQAGRKSLRIRPDDREAEMGKFYFHLRMGEEVITDQEGSDCLDISAARLEALVAARQILADAIRSGNDDTPEAFVIADSEGRELATVPLAVVLPRRLRV